MELDFKIDSLANVLLATSSLDLLRLQKSTGVICISIWHDAESILKSDLKIFLKNALTLIGLNSQFSNLLFFFFFFAGPKALVYVYDAFNKFVHDVFYKLLKALFFMFSL